MATTTNYSWTTPDDTALVKDGAAAIRSLGTSVDTTTKNLNPSTTLGDIEYRSSTANTNTRLGIGSSGQVLTVAAGVPSWATPAGGMTLISTTTISNNATITIGSIPATYKSLIFYCRAILPATDNVELRMRITGDSNNRYYFTTTNEYQSSFNTSSWLVGNNLDNATQPGFIKIELPDYANTSTYKFITSEGVAKFASGAGGLWYNGSGAYDQTSAISSVDFFASSGNLTSGTILLYGVN